MPNKLTNIKVIIGNIKYLKKPLIISRAIIKNHKALV